MLSSHTRSAFVQVLMRVPKMVSCFGRLYYAHLGADSFLSTRISDYLENSHDRPLVLDRFPLGLGRDKSLVITMSSFPLTPLPHMDLREGSETESCTILGRLGVLLEPLRSYLYSGHVHSLARLMRSSASGKAATVGRKTNTGWCFQFHWSRVACSTAFAWGQNVAPCQR